MPITAEGGADVEPIWTPGSGVVETAHVEHFRRWLATRHGVQLSDYAALHAWSVTELEQFWQLVWEYFDVQAATPAERVLVGDSVPGARWFPGATLNVVDQVFRHGHRTGPALIDRSEPGGPAPREVSLAELRRQVAAVAGTLRELGVERGDRVVGYLPDVAEAVIGFLAAASIGAIWSVCGQDYSASAAAERLGQLDPVVLIAADGYRYGGKTHDRRAAVGYLRGELPTLRATVVVSRLDLDLDQLVGITRWADASAGAPR